MEGAEQPVRPVTPPPAANPTRAEGVGSGNQEPRMGASGDLEAQIEAKKLELNATPDFISGNGGVENNGDQQRKLDEEIRKLRAKQVVNGLIKEPNITDYEVRVGEGLGAKLDALRDAVRAELGKPPPATSPGVEGSRASPNQQIATDQVANAQTEATKNKPLGTRLKQAMESVLEALKIMVVAIVGSILVEQTENLKQK